ncbi:MAG TPA: hypothetical protein VKY71_10850 [Actinotalea caeni]|uniref:hypothetical protein n=1 Tax=Actinotalea caeni TaxID=1348467 RepID=UPI0012E1F272|nr:hypothetical protein [Actinotalea caeni]HLV56057.1 hypothetical protein [Actinotalea caeni]
MSDTTPSSSQGGDPRPEAEVPTPPRGVRAPGPVEPWHGPVPPVHGPVGGAGPAGPQPPGQPAGLGQPDPYGRPAADGVTPRAPAPPAPPPPQPHEVWQRPPAAPTPPRRVRWSTVLQVVALVLGLVGTAWVSTDYLRTQWPLAWPRDPVPVSADGTATLAGVTVSLVEARDLGDSPSLPGTDWQPPAGFHAWRVVLATSSTNEDLVSCDVALVDDRDRYFYANTFVDSFVEGYEWSFTCGAADPGSDVPPEQALLVLVPADAEIRSVRIWNTFLNPDVIELPV